MKAQDILFLICFYPFLLCGQTDLIKLQDKLVGLTADTTIRQLNADQIKSINEFWRLFKVIRDAEIDLDQMNGTANFGFSGNTSEEQEIYRINGGIRLSKGSFPQDFEFSTLLSIQVNNGQLLENLSNLRISYDRFLNLKNPFLMEGYAFINRRSDQFLGVDQRYEVGGGFIMAYWYKKLFKNAQAKYNRFSQDRISVKSDENKVIVCQVENCVPIRLNGITASDFSALNNAQQRISNAILKQNSPLRLGMLFGVFYEVENIAHSDSLLTREGKKFFQHDFETTNKFRWEIRPTIDFKISEAASIKIRPQIKFGMPWEWKVDVAGKKEVDARIDFPIIFSLQLSDNFGVDLNYIYYYDHAPNSVLLNDKGPNDKPLYLTANQKHHFVQFQVSYQFR